MGGRAMDFVFGKKMGVDICGQSPFVDTSI
jgi:hypothetical protein